jgi:1,4-alpha-glucan branching enzyme
MTGSAALAALPPRTIVSLPEGSWGQGGFHWIWLNEDTSWIWENIYRIEDEAARLVSRKDLDPRVWRQFIREKFLLESSDWPFLISTGTARDYAQKRAAEHFDRAARLAGWLEPGRKLSEQEEELLKTYETEDSLFKEVVTPDGRVI